MKKELQGFEEGSKVEIYLDSLRIILKKVPNCKKTPDNDSVYGFWYKNLHSFMTDCLCN